MEEIMDDDFYMLLSKYIRDVDYARGRPLKEGKEWESFVEDVRRLYEFVKINDEFIRRPHFSPKLVEAKE